jgi:NADPH2:quinone reductase
MTFDPITIVTRLHSVLHQPLPGLPVQMRMSPQPRPGAERILDPSLNCRRAGVLVLLYPHDGELCLVLTRRTDVLDHHRGQISFPGGSLDPGEDTLAAALREGWEELSINPARLEVLGELSPLYIPPSGFCIYPTVAFVAARPDFIPNPHEVAEVIDTPLFHLMAPATRREEMWEIRGAPVCVPFYAVGHHKVWGATAMVLCELLALLQTPEADCATTPACCCVRSLALTFTPEEFNMKVISFSEFGGPEVLKLEERPTPAPGPGQVLVKLAAIGINFIEIYQRMGWYKVPLPAIPGSEGAGVVETVGAGVIEAKPGDRVAFIGGLGCYATHCLVPGDRLAVLPAPSVSFEQGAAAMIQGMTAHVLATRTYPLKPGDWCLVHAAAGGVGLLLTQIAKMQGATVIGTTSSAAKAVLAREAGADEVILYTEQEFLTEVKRITDGKGVQVVYDSVGKDTFDKSLDCLAPLGTLVSFGQSSGFPAPLDIQRLGGLRSLFVTRPSLFAYTQTHADYLRHAYAVLSLIAAGDLKARIGAAYPLAEAAAAQSALAARQTTGKVVLIP